MAPLRRLANYTRGGIRRSIPAGSANTGWLKTGLRRRSALTAREIHQAEYDQDAAEAYAGVEQRVSQAAAFPGQRTDGADTQPCHLHLLVGYEHERLQRRLRRSDLDLAFLDAHCGAIRLLVVADRLDGLFVSNPGRRGFDRHASLRNWLRQGIR